MFEVELVYYDSSMTETVEIEAETAEEAEDLAAYLYYLELGLYQEIMDVRVLGEVIVDAMPDEEPSSYD